MVYEVKHAGEIVATHLTQSAAIADAKRLGDATVVAHENSGTYESRMQVYPTRGECYSN